MSLMHLPNQAGWQLALAPLAGWPDAAAKPRSALQQLASRFLAWRAQRETLRLLKRVDAATLRDLGITDIEPTGVRRPARPDPRLRRELVEAGGALNCVSRTRCRIAQMPEFKSLGDPGSAAHHSMLRRARDTVVSPRACRAGNRANARGAPPAAEDVRSAHWPRGDNSREKKLSPLSKSALILHAPCSPRGAS